MPAHNDKGLAQYLLSTQMISSPLSFYTEKC